MSPQIVIRKRAKLKKLSSQLHAPEGPIHDQAGQIHDQAGQIPVPVDPIRV
jgi:hypothetical protein